MQKDKEIIISKEKLLKKGDSATLKIEITVPDYEGFIKIRGFKDHTEIETCVSDIQNLAKANEHGFPPFNYREEYTDSEVGTAYHIHKFVVEPEISFMEALDVIRGPLGVFMKAVVKKIFTISGITEELMKEREDELKADSFQIDDNGRLIKVSETAS